MLRPMGPQTYLVVDGHSVLFAVPELEKLHRQRTALGREELIRRLTAFQDATDYHVVVVFDGQGSEVGREKAPGGIQVFYSKTGQTADEVIERLAARYAAKESLIVATGDYKEQETVAAFGARVWNVEMLLEEMQRAEGDVQDWLKKNAGTRRNNR